MPSVNPELTKSQNWLKSLENNIFHVFTSNPSHLEIFVNFDQFDLKLTFGGTKNPNFFIRMLEQVWASDIENFMWFPLQRLLMGQNRS